MDDTPKHIRIRIYNNSRHPRNFYQDGKGRQFCKRNRYRLREEDFYALHPSTACEIALLRGFFTGHMFCQKKLTDSIIQLACGRMEIE
jgi:hypothetical protein